MKDNLPESLDDVKRYEQSRYKGLDQRIVHSIEYRITTRFIQEVAQPEDHILDIPSGYGRFTQYFVVGPWKITAVDLNQPTLQRVQQRFEQRAYYTRGSITEIPFADHSFEGLLSMRLIQHFHTPEVRIASFSEIRRVIKRWAVVSVYSSSALHKLMRKFREFHKITMVDQSQLNREIEQAGLRVIKQKKILPGIHAQIILLLEPQIQQ